MKKSIGRYFNPLILFLFIALSSCIQTGDEERPGMVVNSDYLFAKVWEVSLFKDDGQDKSTLFNNVYIEFRHNFVFRVTQGCDIVDGEWILSSDSTLLVIRLPKSAEPLKQLADEWVITWLTDTEMHLIEQDNKGDEEFHLKVTPVNAINCQSCEHISSVLIDNDWSVTSLIGNVGDVTDDLRGDFLEFKENGEVILYTDHIAISGSWALTDQCRLLVIQWYQGQVYPDVYRHLADNWIIVETDQKLVTLENSTGELELTEGIIPSCPDLHTDLLNTSWTIEFVSINQDDVSNNFSGTGLTLLENNQMATEVVIGPAVLGEWMLTGNCDRIAFDIQAGQLKELSREWMITSTDYQTITLVHEDGSLRMEMHLRKGAPELSAKCLELINHLKYGEWIIRKFTTNGSNSSAQFENYNFQFRQDGTIFVKGKMEETIGKWHPIWDCELLRIEFDPKSSLNDLTGKWKVELFENGINMVCEKMQVKRTVEMVRLE